MAEYKKNSDWKKFENVRMHIVDLDTVTGHDAQLVFGNYMSIDLGIYCIKNDEAPKDLGFLKNSICDKMKSSSYSGFDTNKKDGKPWHNFFMRNQYSKTTEETTKSLRFGSEIEAENFIRVMKETKLGRHYYHHMLVDVNVHPQCFLKLDYTRPWTDEMLYKYFNLTDEEIELIEDEIRHNNTKSSLHNTRRNSTFRQSNRRGYN